MLTKRAYLTLFSICRLLIKSARSHIYMTAICLQHNAGHRSVLIMLCNRAYFININMNLVRLFAYNSLKHCRLGQYRSNMVRVSTPDGYLFDSRKFEMNVIDYILILNITTMSSLQRCQMHRRVRDCHIYTGCLIRRL